MAERIIPVKLEDEGSEKVDSSNNSNDSVDDTINNAQSSHETSTSVDEKEVVRLLQKFSGKFSGTTQSKPYTLTKDHEESSSSILGTNEANEILEQRSNFKSKVTLQIKPVTAIKDCEEYLKKYDSFEERNVDTLPNINVPEKIILVIDRAQDEDCTSFKAANKKILPLAMLKRALVAFVKLKNSINEQHQFAVLVLNEIDVTWMCSFTKDIRKVINVIDKISPCQVEDNFDMNLIFTEILPNIVVPEQPVPLYIIRTIILYGRSYTIPQIEFSDEVTILLEKPYFICDILLTHESLDKSNNCGRIFKYLQDIDKKGLSYFFPVARNTLRLYNSMAKLLGHGLQRPLQKIENDNLINAL